MDPGLGGNANNPGGVNGQLVFQMLPPELRMNVLNFLPNRDLYNMLLWVLGAGRLQSNERNQALALLRAVIVNRIRTYFNDPLTQDLVDQLDRAYRSHLADFWDTYYLDLKDEPEYEAASEYRNAEIQARTFGLTGDWATLLAAIRRLARVNPHGT